MKFSKSMRGLLKRNYFLQRMCERKIKEAFQKEINRGRLCYALACVMHQVEIANATSSLIEEGVVMAEIPASLVKDIQTALDKPWYEEEGL